MFDLPSWSRLLLRGEGVSYPDRAPLAHHSFEASPPGEYEFIV